MAFAKLFGTDDQVLVMLDRDEYGDPEVRIYVEPKGYGVCSFALGFKDTEEGWDKAEQAFKDMTEERGRELFRTAFLDFKFAD